jgi:hypothetical protein
VSGVANLPALEPGELSGFEVWDRDVQAPAGKAEKAAFVTVGATGQVGINRAAREMWGWHEATRLAFDPERRRLAFIPASADDPKAHLLGEFQATVGCKKLLDYYGIDYSETRRYRSIRVADGVLVVELGAER